MRKLIMIVAAMMAPVAVWVAGCRQDANQASFPNGPEVKNLARNSQPVNQPRPAPQIAVIDPEVLATPDRPTFDRIRAVMDREAQLSSRYDSPGLLVLPPMDHADLAAAPAPGYAAPQPTFIPAPTAPVIASSGQPAQRFWSQPAAPIPAPAAPLPADVSAMAAPRLDQFDPILLPEDIPGVYMGFDSPDSGIPGGFGPIGAAPAKPDPIWGDGAPALPPALSSDAFAMVSMEELNTAMREAGGFRPPADFDIKSLLAASFPPAEPTGSRASGLSERLEALVNTRDASQALLPLPDIVGLPSREMTGIDALPAPKTAQAKKPATAMPSLPAEILAKKDETAAAPGGLALPPPPPESGKSADTQQHEKYLADLWNVKETPAAATKAINKAEPDLPESILDFEPSLPDFAAIPAPWALPDAEPLEIMPELAEPGSILDVPAPKTPAPIPAQPQKVNMVPLRPILEKPQLRTGALSNIDAAVEAPPLRF